MPSGTKRSSSERMEKLNLPANAFCNVMNANNTERVKGTLSLSLSLHPRASLSESLIAAACKLETRCITGAVTL